MTAPHDGADSTSHDPLGRTDARATTGRAAAAVTRAPARPPGRTAEPEPAEAGVTICNVADRDQMPNLGSVYGELHPIAQRLADEGAGLRDIVDLVSTLMIYRWCKEHRPEWSREHLSREMGISFPTFWRRENKLRDLTGWDFDTAPVPATALQPPPRIAFGLS